MRPIRLSWVEDQTLMRQGLRTLLELEEDFTVAADSARRRGLI